MRFVILAEPKEDEKFILLPEKIYNFSDTKENI